MSPEVAQWRCDTGSGGVALYHPERRSGAVTQGEAKWHFDTGEATL